MALWANAGSGELGKVIKVKIVRRESPWKVLFDITLISLRDRSKSISPYGSATLAALTHFLG